MTHHHPPSVVVVSGNPRLGSRTLDAATAVGRRLAAELDGELLEPIDLAALKAEIFADDRPHVTRAVERLAAADVAVVATPVYKASYTGLLKAFLDLYGPAGLAGVTAVPLVVTGTATHGLAGEVHLRPVLVELGASVPTASLVVTEQQLGELDAVTEHWWQRARTPLTRAVLAELPEPVEPVELAEATR